MGHGLRNNYPRFIAQFARGGLDQIMHMSLSETLSSPVQDFDVTQGLGYIYKAVGSSWKERNWKKAGLCLTCVKEKEPHAKRAC